MFDPMHGPEALHHRLRVHEADEAGYCAIISHILPLWDGVRVQEVQIFSGLARQARGCTL